MESAEDEKDWTCVLKKQDPKIDVADDAESRSLNEKLENDNLKREQSLGLTTW